MKTNAVTQSVRTSKKQRPHSLKYHFELHMMFRQCHIMLNVREEYRKKNLNPLAVLHKWNHVWSMSRDPHRKLDIYTFAFIFFVVS